MAEAFEQGREAVEAVAAGIHPRQHAVEFVGDSFLFGGGRDCNTSVFKFPLGYMAQSNSTVSNINKVVERLVDGMSEKTLIEEIGVEVDSKNMLVEYGFLVSPDVGAKRCAGGSRPCKKQLAAF